MNNQKEIWEDIPNYEGLYQISSLGRVKSMDRTVVSCNRSPQNLIGKILNTKNKRNKGGYLTVNLCKKSKKSTKTIHQLVAVVFLNHNPCGYKIVVDHKDNNKLNNTTSNLRLITQRENANQKHIKSSSDYVGVGWHKQKKKWDSKIRIGTKQRFLGLFVTELEASNQYQKALSNLDKYNGNNSEFRDYLNSL